VKLRIKGVEHEMSSAKVQDLCRLLEDGSHLTTRHLPRVEVDGCKIGKKGAEHFARVLGRDRSNRPNNQTLVELKLPNNSLGNPGTSTIFATLNFNRSLRTLGLYGNGIGAKGALAIAEVLKARQTRLETLHLGNNNIGPKGAEHLAGALGQCQLLKVTLDFCQIGDHGAAEFAAALRSDPVLAELDLRQNSIADVGALSRALLVCPDRDGKNSNTHLTTLDLRSNSLGGRAKDMMTSCLHRGSAQVLS